jgi:hypothetical protein
MTVVVNISYAVSPWCNASVKTTACVCVQLRCTEMGGVPPRRWAEYSMVSLKIASIGLICVLYRVENVSSTLIVKIRLYVYNRRYLKYIT